MVTLRFTLKTRLIGVELILLVVDHVMMKERDVLKHYFDYYRQHKLKIKVARIFNTYGPRMHPNDGRVVSNFIIQALKNKDITIYGDGKQTRSLLC